MITLNLDFHWAWLLICAIIIAFAIYGGIYIYDDYKHPRQGMLSGCGIWFGIAIIILGLMVAAIIGGIFIW